MSEEQAENVEPADQAEGVGETAEVIAYKSDRDWFLQDVIRLANLGLGIGITVIAEGAVISGTLIGGKQFFEELAAEMGKASYAGNDGAEMLKMIGESWAANGLRYVKPEGAADDWAPAAPGFIHIKNARIYSPGQSGMPSNRGVLWRGKLNAISGFSIGSFDPTA